MNDREQNRFHEWEATRCNHEVQVTGYGWPISGRAVHFVASLLAVALWIAACCKLAIWLGEHWS